MSTKTFKKVCRAELLTRRFTFRYLASSINATSGIRSQDATSVFASVYNGNPEGIDIAFTFLEQNYQRIGE